MLTFKDVKESSVAEVAGVCTDSTKFATMVNDAVRRLMRRGDFVGTVSPIHVCVKQGCVVMPRYVQSVRKVSLCNQPMPVGNLWYRFLNAEEGWSGLWEHATATPGVLHANGMSPCYSDIYGDARTIRAYPAVRDDIGKTITIFGIDNGNQPLRTDNGDGTWSEGWTITLNAPYGFPDPVWEGAAYSPYVRRIDRVVKDVTQGRVRLYAYDAAQDVLEDLAVYDPGETSPSYTRYSLHINGLTTPGSFCSSSSACCCSTVRSITALVKLRFIPAKYDTDWVMIDNTDAIKDMVQAIRLREANDLELATNFELSAIRELNRQLEDYFPDDVFSASNEIFSGPSFTNHCF